MDDRVIILMATYNGAKYIREQIQSILQQDYKEWRLYISDDGSSDTTVDIVNEYANIYPEKISIVQGGNFGNARDNFLNLLSICEGKYIMFCDQDDKWKSEKVSGTLKKMKEIEVLKGDEKPIMIFADLEVVDENMNMLNASFMKYQSINPSRTDMKELIIQNVVTGCTVMINDKLRKLALKYNDNKNIVMHDWWIALVASRFGTIGYVDKQLIKYRQHSSNSVGAKDVRSMKYYLHRVKEAEEVKKALEMTQIQAGEFLRVYGDMMTDAEKNILNDYAGLMKCNKLKRINFYIKNDILKSRFVQNVGLMIWG